MSLPNELTENFKNPDRRYAVYPIKHHLAVNCDQYDELGFGGVVKNVEYTKNFPDDMSEWEKYEKTIRQFIDKGMNVWLYDEQSYPSGIAGGYIPEKYPETVAQGLFCYNFMRKIPGPRFYKCNIPDGELYRAVLLSEDETEVIDVTNCLNENGFMYIDVPEGVYTLIMMCKRRLFEGTHAVEGYHAPLNYVSLSDKSATEKFIECTHEKYKDLLKDEFGKGILATFTDEPSLIAWYIPGGMLPVLPWHENYPKEFEKIYGYDFMYACIAVLRKNTPESIKRRCDFWEYIAQTVSQNYFKVIKDWCGKNGLKSSGHLIEEEILQAHIYNYGSYYKCIKQLDWPGIDQLSSEPNQLMYKTYHPVARVVSSIADLYGEGESFTEFSAHDSQGKVLPFDYYIYSANWHLVMGINNFTSYYGWLEITNEQIKTFNKYIARLGYLLRLGTRVCNTALVYPEPSMWAAFNPNINFYNQDNSYDIMSVQNAYTVSAWSLFENQIEYDYIDNEVIENSTLNGDGIVFNNRKYSSVILPCCRVIRDKVAEKLLALADNGGTLIFCQELPKYSRETGKKSIYAEKFKALVNCGKAYLICTDDIKSKISHIVPEKCKDVTLTSSEHNVDTVFTHIRTEENGRKILFISNMYEKDFSGTVSVSKIANQVYIADACSGNISSCDFEVLNGKTILPINLKSCEAKAFIIE